MQEDSEREFVNRIAQKVMGLDQFPCDAADAERVTVTLHPEQISTPLMGKAGNQARG